MMNARRAWVFFYLLMCGAGVARGVPAEEGLYARFVTGRGEFVARLEHGRAPVAVANFVGLAEGTRGWLDAERGVVVEGRGFYDGLVFHRVIPGFVIQSGSRNGLGTDGPGYAWGDEYHAELVHDGAGVLSMANSGADTNGSQFFVTLNATAWLDGKHSIFGRVVEGMDVVEAIGAQATEGSEGRTVLERVEIVRVGAAAQAWDAGAVAGLPEWVAAGAAMVRNGEGWGVELERGANCRYDFFTSEGLVEWGSAGWVQDGAGAGEGAVDVTGLVGEARRMFFRVAKARYAERVAGLDGRRVELAFNRGGGGVLAVDFSDWTYDWNGVRGKVAGASLDGALAAWKLGVDLGEEGVWMISLKFRGVGGGWFAVRPYGATDGVWPLSGEFTVE